MCFFMKKFDNQEDKTVAANLGSNISRYNFLQNHSKRQYQNTKSDSASKSKAILKI